MKRETMLKRLEAGYDPIAICLEKWRSLKKEWDKNGYNSSLEHGSSNCALCEVHQDMDGCHDCPLSLMGDECYSEIGNSYGKTIDTENAQPMIDALLKAEEWLKEQECKDKPKTELSFKVKLEFCEWGGLIIRSESLPFVAKFMTPDSDGKALKDFMESLDKGDKVYIVTKNKLKK